MNTSTEGDSFTPSASCTVATDEWRSGPRTPTSASGSNYTPLVWSMVALPLYNNRLNTIHPSLWLPAGCRSWPSQFIAQTTISESRQAGALSLTPGAVAVNEYTHTHTRTHRVVTIYEQTIRDIEYVLLPSSIQSTSATSQYSLGEPRSLDRTRTLTRLIEPTI